MDFIELKGATGYSEKIAEPSDSAARYGSGLVDVFSTPALVAFTEKTCLLSVNDKLPAGYSSVGTRINISHERATPIGKKVSCNSVLLEVEGKKLIFEVFCSDENGIIGRGFHERYIIDVGKFIAKLPA